MPSAHLKISAETREFNFPLTVNFEKHLLLEQAQGKKLLYFEHIEQGKFILYFGSIYEVGVDVAQELRNVQVGPWCMYVYSDIRIGIDPGESFNCLRLAEDFCDVMSIGDHVQFVDIRTMQPIGTAEIISLRKSRIRDLPGNSFRKMCPRVKSHKQVVEFLSTVYEQEVTLDTVVAKIGLRSTSKFNNGRTLHPVLSFINSLFKPKELLLLYATILCASS